jgi:hypothetical protein
MIRTALVLVILAMLVVMIFCASYLWDRVVELVVALQGVSGMLDYATGECRCGVCEYCNVQKRADKALAKAKEVLGDGN